MEPTRAPRGQGTRMILFHYIYNRFDINILNSQRLIHGPVCMDQLILRIQTLLKQNKSCFDEHTTTIIIFFPSSI
jgi:hypothetical protein